MSTATATVSRTGLILLLLCAAQFMVVLDIAIVNVALPSIQSDLDMSQDSLQWVVIAYGLMLGGFVMLGGRLADLLGRKRVLISGLTIFVMASLLAGLAHSAEFLIASRALQGFGAAMIPPAALSILAVTFEEGSVRNRALGLYGAVAGISATVGVIASGLLSDGPGWRAIFLLNVPIGIALIAMAARFLRGESRAVTVEPVAIVGAATLTGSLLLVVYALSQGPVGGWTTLSTLALFAGAVALMAAFLAIESTSPEPLVPGIAVRNRILVAANLGALFTFGTFIALVFLGTLLMQQVLGYSATKTGMAWVATSGSVLLRRRSHGQQAGGPARPEEAAGRRASTARRRHAAAGLCSGRRQLLDRPATPVPARRDRGGGGSTSSPDRRARRRRGTADRPRLWADRDVARDRWRYRRGRGGDGPRLPGRPRRLPSRVRRPRCHRRAGCSHLHGGVPPPPSRKDRCMSDLTHTFTVDATPQDAYEAIIDVRSWWGATNIVGPTDRLGADWFYLVPNIHFSKQHTAELVPGERVVWEFTDGHLEFIAEKGEWIGTTGRFDITSNGGQTQVTFTHEGLASADECFDVCHDAWRHYITESLRQRIETGHGTMRTTEQDQAAVRQHTEPRREAVSGE